PLADLRALEVVAAVQAGAQHEMPLQQGAGARENFENLRLRGIHGIDVAEPGAKKQNQFCTPGVSSSTLRFVIPTVQLEDELGDVLEKAMQQAGLNETALSAATGVPVGKIRDAIDYRPDFSLDELRRLAVALGLNEIGFCALGCGRYPQPEITDLQFSVWPLRMTHGIGV